MKLYIATVTPALIRKGKTILLPSETRNSQRHYTRYQNNAQQDCIASVAIGSNSPKERTRPIGDGTTVDPSCHGGGAELLWPAFLSAYRWVQYLQDLQRGFQTLDGMFTNLMIAVEPLLPF